MARYPRCIMATAVVPWDERGEFMEDLFRHQVRSELATLTKNLYVFGTAGEGYAVNDRQFDRIVRAFHDEMQKGGAEAMVGIISLSLPTVKSASRAGATTAARKTKMPTGIAPIIQRRPAKMCPL